MAVVSHAEQLSSCSCVHVAQDFHDLGHILLWLFHLLAENPTYLVIPHGVAHLCFLWLKCLLYLKKKKEIWENVNCDEYSNWMSMITLYSLYFMFK